MLTAVFLVFDVSDAYFRPVVAVFGRLVDAEKFVIDDKVKSARYLAAVVEANEKKVVDQHWNDWIKIHYPEFYPEYFPRYLEIQSIEVR